MSDSNFFTLKLYLESQLKKLSIGNEFGSKVVIEGFLGEIKNVVDLEETLTKIEFERGELCLDINIKDFVRLLEKKMQDSKLAGEIK